MFLDHLMTLGLKCSGRKGKEREVEEEEHRDILDGFLIPSGHRPEPAERLRQENCRGKFLSVVSHKNLAFPGNSQLSHSLEIEVESWLDMDGN